MYLKLAAYKSTNVNKTQTRKPVIRRYLTLPPPTIPASSITIHHGTSGEGS